MPINWSLFQPVDVAGAVRAGFERGEKRGEAIRLKSALAAFAANPSDPKAQGAIAAASPEFALEMAKAGWKRQGDAAKEAMVAKYFADDPTTGVPPGINGKPQGSAALRAKARALAGVDFEAARLMGEMADDAEAAEVRAAEESVKGQTVKWETDPITGKRTALDMYGNPIGTNTEEFVRDRRGIPHSAKWAAEHPDEVQPPVIGQAPPPPDPLAPDQSGNAQPKFDLFGPVPANALPGENMETYLLRKTNERIAADPANAETYKSQLIELVQELRGGKPW